MTVQNSAPIAGEPIVIRFVSENTSESPQRMHLGATRLDDQEETCADRDNVALAEMPTGPLGIESRGEGHMPEPPGTQKAHECDITRVCNINARESETPGSHLICYEPRFPSEGCRTCVSFEIRAPEGIDREVFERLPSKLRDVGVDKRMLDFSILDEYPTSTYAGYELAKLHQF